jgi:TIR domain
VFLDDWELVPGDLLAVKLQEGLAAADAVVFVVSAQSVGRGWVNEEFAAAIGKAAAGQRRLIPVIVDDVPLPAFAGPGASRARRPGFPADPGHDDGHEGVATLMRLTRQGEPGAGT